MQICFSNWLKVFKNPKGTVFPVDKFFLHLSCWPVLNSSGPSSPTPFSFLRRPNPSDCLCPVTMLLEGFDWGTVSTYLFHGRLSVS